MSADHQVRVDAKTDQQKARSNVAIVISWLFVVVMLALIFFMSAKTGDALNTDSGFISMAIDMLSSWASALFGQHVDVSPVGHFGEYFLLGIALTNALRLSMPLPRAGAYAVIFASLYGVTDELHQILVPGRSCDPFDWLVDTIAASLAAIISIAIMRIRQKRNG